MVAIQESAVGAAPEQLVPAVYNSQQDSKGFLWDIRTRGEIQHGSDNCFSNGCYMYVGGSSYSVNRQMMTKDGSEFLLGATERGLQITRRVKLDAKGAFARYVEVIHNPSQAPISTQFMWRTQLGRNQAANVVTDKGRPIADNQQFVLDKKEKGVLVFGRPGTGQHSVLFYLPNHKNQLSWSCTSQNKAMFQIIVTLNVPPGKTISLTHGLAQRRLNSLPTGGALAKLFKPFQTMRWSRGLPKDVRASILNLRTSGFGGIVFSEMPTLESLEVTRGTRDVLAVNEQTRLRGSATLKSLKAHTQFGAVDVGLEQIAALIGKKGVNGNSRAFLRDGQVLIGDLEIEDLQFAMSTGITMALKFEQIDALALHAELNDGRPGTDVAALVELMDGSRIAIEHGVKESIACTTPWGEMNIALSDILRCQPAAETVGLRFDLRNGTQIFAYASTRAIKLPTTNFGEQEINLDQIRSLRAISHKVDDEQSTELTVPYLVLAGENRLVGRVDLPSIDFVAGGELIPVPPNQIRSLTQADWQDQDDIGLFTAELWDGSTLSGSLRQSELPVRSGEQQFSVNTRDVVEIQVPVPTITDALRQQIAKLIGKLGDPEFRQREMATEGIGELGYLAKPQLLEALDQTTDPEVRRRVESLLAELGDE
jgi:hypothetical protein